MTSASHYRTRLTQVAAMQWTGENQTEMNAFLGASFEEWDGEAAVLTSAHSAWADIYPGDWAVLAPGGVVSRMSDDEFQAAYEAVDG